MPGVRLTAAGVHAGPPVGGGGSWGYVEGLPPVCPMQGSVHMSTRDHPALGLAASVQVTPGQLGGAQSRIRATPHDSAAGEARPCRGTSRCAPIAVPPAD